MAAMLPSRYGPYEELLNRRLREASPEGRRDAESPSGMKLPSRFSVLVGGVGTLLTLGLLCGRSQDPSRLAAGRRTLFSANLLGGGTAVADYAPLSAAPAPLPSPSPRAPRAPAPAAAPRPSPTPCIACEAPAPATEVLFQNLPPSPSPSPLQILPAGTRMMSRLAEPVVVGPGGVPLVANLEEDLRSEERLLVPGGARIVGEAHVGPDGERVLVNFSSLVLHGRSVLLSGIALGPDGQLGIKARLVRRLSASRRGLGKALHAVGTALSFGLIGSSSAAGEAATQAVAGEVSGFARTSDPPVILEVPPGALSVFVRADVSLP